MELVAIIEFQLPVRVPLQSPVRIADDAPNGTLLVIVAISCFLIGNWCPFRLIRR